MVHHRPLPTAAMRAPMPDEYFHHSPKRRSRSTRLARTRKACVPRTHSWPGRASRWDEWTRRKCTRAGSNRTESLRYRSIWEWFNEHSPPSGDERLGRAPRNEPGEEALLRRRGRQPAVQLPLGSERSVGRGRALQELRAGPEVGSRLRVPTARVSLPQRRCRGTEVVLHGLWPAATVPIRTVPIHVTTAGSVARATHCTCTCISGPGKTRPFPACGPKSNPPGF
jgi:hypothetical protein